MHERVGELHEEEAPDELSPALRGGGALGTHDVKNTEGIDCLARLRGARRARRRRCRGGGAAGRRADCAGAGGGRAGRRGAGGPVSRALPSYRPTKRPAIVAMWWMLPMRSRSMKRQQTKSYRKYAALTVMQNAWRGSQVRARQPAPVRLNAWRRLLQWLGIDLAFKDPQALLRFARLWWRPQAKLVSKARVPPAAPTGARPTPMPDRTGSYSRA